MSLDSAPARPLAGAAAVLPVFALALFVSAALMFAVQPMFTRMVLPALGGSPGVWSVAMVFFQGVLLFGYLYAHLLTRHLPLRLAALTHLILLCLALSSLPVAMAAGWGAPPPEGAALWLIGLFAASVGLPFFALAANGPLLQAWFARTGHRHAGDPYFLYGASNLGSFCGLLLYPLAFEPLLRLAEQSRLWTLGFAGLVALIAAASLLALRAGGAAAPLAKAAPLPWSARLACAGYAFVPSGLLVAVTAQLSTDVAAAPFLWVLPLALFLLTFTLAFQERPPLPHALMLKLQPWLVAAAILAAAASSLFNLFAAIAVVLACAFVCTMVAHGELYRRRPAPAQLTEFYLWMSAGGVCGGIFSALLAPQIFNSVLEYPILIVAAVLCRPAFANMPLRAWAGEAGAIVLVAALAALAAQSGLVHIDSEWAFGRFLVIAALCIVIALSGRDEPRLAGLTAATLILMLAIQPGAAKVHAVRSFFGVHRVSDSGDGKLRLLFHGTTIHGGQRLDPATGALAAGRPEMLTYYYSGGSFGQAIAAARAAKGGPLADVAVVGLGAGTLACHRAPGEDWRFFEIDPEVARIARDPAQFSFLSQCAPDAEIVLGDARLTLAGDAHLYDAILLDAFSSDAIPVHLLTKEALNTYFSKLRRGGIIAMNITNRHLQLSGVVARTAADLGLTVMVGRATEPPDFAATYHARATIAVIARDPADLAALAGKPDWRIGTADAEVRPWTDDYANQLQAIWLKLREQ